MDNEKLERLVAYLEQNVERYGREPLRDALRRQGHDPALIDEALAEHDRRSRLRVILASSPDPAAPGGEPDPEKSDRILAYLQAYSDRYSLEALREQLVQIGYDPAAIDQAIATFREQKKPTHPAVYGALSFGCGLLVVILIVVALVILAVGGFCVYLFYQMSQEGHPH